MQNTHPLLRPPDISSGQHPSQAQGPVCHLPNQLQGLQMRLCTCRSSITTSWVLCMTLDLKIYELKFINLWTNYLPLHPSHFGGRGSIGRHFRSLMESAAVPKSRQVHACHCVVRAQYYPLEWLLAPASGLLVPASELPFTCYKMYPIFMAE